MKLKNLAAAAVCVAAIGGTAGAAPAAAKSDNTNGNGKIRRCETKAAKNFTCVTESGEVTIGSCPTGYTVTQSITSNVNIDANGDGLVCFSSTLGYVDDDLV
jgi:hypothetical protein